MGRGGLTSEKWRVMNRGVIKNTKEIRDKFGKDIGQVNTHCVQHIVHICTTHRHVH